MAVYNILTKESRNYESTNGWKSDSSVSLNQNKSYNLNFSTNSKSSNNRYVLHSKIKSSDRSDINNQSIYKDYFSPLSILICNDTLAIKNNLYNIYTGKFFDVFPLTTQYFLPTQQIKTTFNGSQRAKNTPLSQNDFDELTAKDTVLIPHINVHLSSDLDRIVYSAECDNDCAASFVSHFIQPSYDNETSKYHNINNYGISFNNPTGEISSLSLLRLTIKKNNEPIISINYNTIFAGTEIVVKHPEMINYQKFILPSTDLETNI